MATISGFAIVQEGTKMELFMHQNGLIVPESHFASRASPGAGGDGYDDDQGSRTLVSLVVSIIQYKYCFITPSDLSPE